MNAIKQSGADGLALQVTKPARAAGLVEEAGDETTYRADVRVWSFDHFLLVVDLDRVSETHCSELVVKAAKDSDSVYRAMDSKIQIAGNGYQVQLPPAEDAGFEVGDRAPCRPVPGVMGISLDDGTAAGREAARLGADLVSIRKSQVG